MENEDYDILNVEFDPRELEGIDEDFILGGAGAKAEPEKKAAVSTNSKLPPVVIKAAQTVQEPEEEAQTSGEAVIEQDSIDESKSADSGDDDEEETDDDKDRSKFRTDRSAVNTGPRPVAKRVGIPDSLDNVQINQKEAQFIRSPPKKQRKDFYPNRFGQPPNAKKILLNPHFQGTVPIRPQMRLAWDVADRAQTIQIGAVKLRPTMQVPPGIIRPTSASLCAPNQLVPHVQMIQGRPPSVPMRPLGPPMSSPPRSVPPQGYRYPPPPPMWNASQPPTSMPRAVFSGGPLMAAHRPATIYGSVQSQSSSVLQPLPNYSMPPPRISLTGSIPRPLNSLANSVIRPPSSSTASNDWLNMTEDFLRRTRMPPPPIPQRHPSASDSFSPPKPNVSRQRQAADYVKRKYRTQDKQKKPLLSSRSSTEEPEIADALLTIGAVRNEKASVDGVDADYLRKLDEQKQQRELILQRKELRRSQMAKTRQEQANGTRQSLTTAPGLVQVKRAEISLASAAATKSMVGRRRI